MPGWGDLPSEAFEQRHEIKEGGREEDLLAGEDGNEGAMQTVTVEDKTSDVVVWGVHGQDTRSSWSCGAVTADTLTWLAEQGDVQNAVSNDQPGLSLKLSPGEHVYCTFWRPQWGSWGGKSSRIGE